MGKNNAYEAAWKSAAFFPQTEAGYLQIDGPDQEAFIQRQTSNDINLLRPERALLTVLTSPTARILDVFYLLREKTNGEDQIGALTLPGRGAQTARFLKSRIFFMDKVSVNEASGQIAQIDLSGPEAQDLLRRLGIEALPTHGQLISLMLDGSPTRILALNPAYGLGYRLLAPAESAPGLCELLSSAGASQLDAQDYLILRVESGQPEVGHELNEEYTPLETGLEAAVSGNKGCYTGQEILARQVTYDKVTQKLCGLRLQAVAELGDGIWADGKRVGRITSSVKSPRFGALALAVVKRPYNQPGSNVQVGEQIEEAQPAVVSSLPFQ
jgi:folate-binding protein YgfZ